MKIVEAYVYNIPFNPNCKLTALKSVCKQLKLGGFDIESIEVTSNWMFVYPIVMLRFFSENERLLFLYYLKNTGINYFRPITVPNLFPYLINKDFDLIIYNLPHSFGFINTDEVMREMAEAIGFKPDRIRCSFPKWNPNYENPSIVVKFYAKEDRDEFFKFIRNNLVWCDTLLEGLYAVQAQPYLGGEPLEIYRCARAYAIAGIIATVTIFDGIVYIMRHFDHAGIPVQTFDELNAAMSNSQCKMIGDYP